MLPALKKYMVSADSISWPLRLLDKVVDAKEGRIDVIAEVLARHEPGYERDPTKKIQLLTHLGGAQARAACRRWWRPTSTTWTRASATRRSRRCCKQGDEAVGARAPARRCFAKEESLRLRIRIADGFAELGWPVADRRADVEKMLPDAYQIEARGADVRIKKKPGAKE